MAAEHLKVVIVGSGVAGAVLALALQRLATVRPHVTLQLVLVDAATTFHAVGAGFGLSPNGIRPLRQLGLMPELLKGSQVVTAMRLYDATTKSVLFDNKIPPEIYGEPTVVSRHIYLVLD